MIHIKQILINYLFVVFSSLPFALASYLEDMEILVRIDFQALCNLTTLCQCYHLGFSILSSAFREMASKLHSHIPFHTSCICDVDSAFGEVQQQQYHYSEGRPPPNQHRTSELDRDHQYPWQHLQMAEPLLPVPEQRTVEGIVYESRHLCACHARLADAECGDGELGSAVLSLLLSSSPSSPSSL